MSDGILMWHEQGNDLLGARSPSTAAHQQRDGSHLRSSRRGAGVMLSWIFEAIARIRSLFSKSDLDRKLQEELDAHIEFATEENIRRGMPLDVARREAM